MLRSGSSVIINSNVVYLDEGESRQQDCLFDETVQEQRKIAQWVLLSELITKIFTPKNHQATMSREEAIAHATHIERKATYFKIPVSLSSLLIFRCILRYSFPRLIFQATPIRNKLPSELS